MKFKNIKNKGTYETERKMRTKKKKKSSSKNCSSFKNIKKIEKNFKYSERQKNCTVRTYIR